MKKLEIGNAGGGLKDYVHLDICPGPCVEIVADMMKIPCEDEYWDKIFTSNTLEHAHWTEVCDCLKEWFRVLKHGGELELIVPNIHGAMHKYNNQDDISWEDLMGQIFCQEPQTHNQMHKSGYSERYLEEILRECGFYDIQFQGEHRGLGGDLWIKCKKVVK